MSRGLVFRCPIVAGTRAVAGRPWYRGRVRAPRQNPPDHAARTDAAAPDAVDEEVTVPDDLVIPPRPPLPAQPVSPEPAVEADAADADVEIDVVADDAVVVDVEVEEIAGLEPVALEAEPDADHDDVASDPLGVLWAGTAADDDDDERVPAVVVSHLRKDFGASTAVDDLSWEIAPGTFSGLVGPNGAGKTTTLSMISGLLRPDGGTVRIHGVDIRAHEREAKRLIGVLPDRLRTFDRLTGRQLLVYAGLLRDLPGPVVDARVAALADALDLTDALSRIVGDYSAGMTKKIMLAAAMIHAPRVLVLDEPFEALDPQSAATILDILRTYTANGGTVVLSSHGMELIERVCDRVAVLVGGELLAEGTVDEVRGEGTLAERYLEIVGGAGESEGLEWLHTFSG